MLAFTTTREFDEPLGDATMTNQRPQQLLDWSTACGVAGTVAGENVWMAEYRSGQRRSPWLRIPRRTAPSTREPTRAGQP